MRDLGILIVDDSQAERQAAYEQLNGQGHEITYSNSFTDARDLIRNRKYDVVLTDLMLIASDEGMGPVADEFIGKMIGIGWILAVMARKLGVPKAAIVSSGNLHAHPLYWACNALQGPGAGPGERSLMLPGLWAFTGYDCPTTNHQGSHPVKAWDRVLEHIYSAEEFVVRS